MKKESLIVWGVALVVLAIVVFGIYKLSGVDPNQLTLPEPISANDHITGNQSAKVVLVEYGDYQCPACGLYHPITKSLIEKYGEQIAFVYRHFPIRSAHKHAQIAGQAAEAAGKQDKFWEMHDKLFETQDAGICHPEMPLDGEG